MTSSRGNWVTYTPDVTRQNRTTLVVIFIFIALAWVIQAVYMIRR